MIFRITSVINLALACMYQLLYYYIKFIVKFDRMTTPQKFQDDPRCYYHPQMSITNFCLHSKCILPLCEECLAFHRQNTQQMTGQHISKIIKYQQCKQIAIESITMEMNKLQKGREDFNQSYQLFTKEINQKVTKVLQEIKEEILNTWSIPQMHQKLNENRCKIMNGSIKETINHYQFGNYYQQPSQSFQWHCNESTLKRFVMAQCINKLSPVNTQKSSEKDANYRNSEIQSFCQKQFGNNSLQTNHENQRLKQSYEIKPSETLSKTRESEKKFIMNRSNRKKRAGIFVSTSPKFDKENLDDQLIGGRECSKIDNSRMETRQSEQTRKKQKNPKQERIIRCSSEKKLNNKFFDQNTSQPCANSRAITNRKPQLNGSIQFQPIPLKISSTKALKTNQSATNSCSKLSLKNDTWKRVVKMKQCHQKINIQDFSVPNQPNKIKNITNTVNEKGARSDQGDATKKKLDGLMIMDEIMTPQEMREMINRRSCKNINNGFLKENAIR